MHADTSLPFKVRTKNKAGTRAGAGFYVYAICIVELSKEKHFLAKPADNVAFKTGKNMPGLRVENNFFRASLLCRVFSVARHCAGYGTRKTFPVYGHFAIVPGGIPRMSTYP